MLPNSSFDHFIDSKFEKMRLSREVIVTFATKKICIIPETENQNAFQYPSILELKYWFISKSLFCISVRENSKPFYSKKNLLNKKWLLVNVYKLNSLLPSRKQPKIISKISNLAVEII